jgi:hypothetical protein
MTDYVEAPKVTLDNDDPTLRDDSVRAFLDAENAKPAALFAGIAEADDEREQTQRYSECPRRGVPGGLHRHEGDASGALGAAAKTARSQRRGPAAPSLCGFLRPRA